MYKRIIFLAENLVFIVNGLNDEGVSSVDGIDCIDAPLVTLLDCFILLPFEIVLRVNDLGHESIAQLVELFQFGGDFLVVFIAATDAQALIAMAALKQAIVGLTVVAFERCADEIER